jgi:phosphate-selective porin OprO and OprP
LRIQRSLGAALLLGLGFAAGAARAQTDAGLIVVRPAGKEPTLTIGGLLQFQADGGDRGDARWTNDNDRFYLRRARLNATGRFLEELDFRFEMDLAGSLSNSAGLRAQLTDGYINWNRYAGANLRAGQFKTPFGFEQLYGDPRLLTIERSLANDRLTLNRQLGLQVGGDLLEKRLSYAAGTFNGNGVNNNFNDNDKLDLVGRVAVVPWQGKLFGDAASWSIGANGYTAEDTALALSTDLGVDSTPTTADRDGIFSGKRRGFGADTQLVSGRFELWAEYLSARFEPADGIPKPRFKAGGGYVQASFFVIPKRLQVVLKQETFDPRDDAKNDETDTSTLGVNYYIKGHDLKLMADYLRVKAGQLDPQDKLIARLQVGF